MLSLESLKTYGANVEEGLGRCMNNEQFYLMLVKKAIAKDDTPELKTALETGNLDRAFEICHNIKGVAGNLALTPILVPVAEMTEYLRNRTVMDYTPYLAAVIEKTAELKALAE